MGLRKDSISIGHLIDHLVI